MEKAKRTELIRPHGSVPLTAREAKACCTCEHWHKLEETKGECRHPEKRWGVTYENPKTGKQQHVEWWTTGCYATCKFYSPDDKD